MTKKQKIQAFSVFLIILITVIFIKSHKKEEVSVSKSNESQSSNINCSQAIVEDIVPFIDFAGRINSLRKINIVSEVNGISNVSNEKFEVGESFKKGEVLIDIKDADVDLELKSIKSQFLALLVQVLPDVKMDFPSLGNKLQTYINNFTLNGKLNNFPNTTTSKERNFLSSRQVFANYYTIKALENRLDKFKIRAPFDGVVTQALIDPGSNVIIGQPLGAFIDPNNYEISTSVSISESNIIKIGDRVVISSDDLSQDVIAYIERIGSHINELTQSIDVFIKVDNANIKDGMYVTGKIQCDILENVTKIERSKLIDNNKIYLLKNDSLRLKTVDVITFQDEYAIVNGFTNNDCVVEQYRNYFYDGMSVK